MKSDNRAQNRRTAGELALRFPGEPKAVQSFRFTRAGHKYQPVKTAEWKAYISASALAQLPAGWKILDRAISIEAEFLFTLPKNAKKADREMLGRGEFLPKTTRPDLTDNLFKGLIDALTGIVWRDDALIHQVSGRKCYSTVPEIKLIARWHND
ncbi:MAG: RusA family crossover junction endodeoxyribonuclease [Victivallaceae bacterium]